MQSFLHRLFWGAVLIGVGALFLFNQAGVISIDIGEMFSSYWPVILILIGIQGMLLQRNGGFYWNPLLVLLGMFFLARNLEWIDWELHDLIRFIGPVALILVGLNLIARGGRPKKQPGEDSGWNSVPKAPPVPPPAPSMPEYRDVEPEPPIDRGPPPAPDSLGWDDAAPGLKGEQPQGGFSHEPSHEPSREPSDEPFHESSHERHHRTRDFRGRGEAWKHHHKSWKERAEAHGHGYGYWDHSSQRESHTRFIGDFDIGSDYFELRPMNISHFIGDTRMDLTRAQIPIGETRIYVSSFIGDVKVFVPNDFSIGVRVVSSSLIGDVSILEQKRGGVFNQMNLQSPGFDDAPKRIVFIVSTFIGDVRIKKVG